MEALGVLRIAEDASIRAPGIGIRDEPIWGIVLVWGLFEERRM